MFLLRNTVYMKEGHHTRPATSDSCSDWTLEGKQWRNIENYYFKTYSGIIFSCAPTGSSTLHPSLPGPGRGGPALLLYQLGPARLHYCAVLLTVLERWVAPCLLLSLSAFCILGNNTLQTLEFS